MELRLRWREMGKITYFTTGHAMEEEILRLNARHKSAIDESAGFRRSFEYWKTGQRTTGYH